jgi:hypothetical protein
MQPDPKMNSDREMHETGHLQLSSGFQTRLLTIASSSDAPRNSNDRALLILLRIILDIAASATIIKIAVFLLL